MRRILIILTLLTLIGCSVSIVYINKSDDAQIDKGRSSGINSNLDADLDVKQDSLKTKEQ